MRRLNLALIVLTLATGLYFLTTGLIVLTQVDPLELHDFAWHLAAVALMAGVVYRQFLRAQSS